MSMQIANDAQSRTAIINLNSNKSNVEKLLGKISTGLKIVGAADDASGWSISERMRELIRSFSQDHENVQNCSALTRTAERGVDQIVQNLRTLKELAIDAANDSNNDWDRSVIQKEVDQRLEIIDDIAHGTEYNGKILLNGNYRIPVFSSRNTTVEDILSGINEAYGTTTSGQTKNGANSYLYKDWIFDVNLSFAKDTSNPYSWAEAWTGSSVGSTQTNQFAVYLDFSSITATKDYPQTLHNQGFSILCGGCHQFINIVFDATKSVSQSTYGRPPGAQSNPLAREFTIGVKDVQSGDDLAETILKGVYANKEKIANTGGYSNGSYVSKWDESTADNALVDNNHQLRIARDPDDHSKIMILKDSLALQFRDSAIRKPVQGNPLWVQHGTLAGQRFNVYINSMTKNTLGLNGLSVRTREDANDAIGIINEAIEYALDEATTLGAYLQRMEMTDLNVTTLSENAQASESTIRDADMAKEMVDYTKYNLLLQSSQVMLAQANQNSSQVINLIQ